MKYSASFSGRLKSLTHLSNSCDILRILSIFSFNFSNNCISFGNLEGRDSLVRLRISSICFSVAIRSFGVIEYLCCFWEVSFLKNPIATRLFNSSLIVISLKGEPLVILVLLQAALPSGGTIVSCTVITSSFKVSLLLNKSNRHSAGEPCGCCDFKLSTFNPSLSIIILTSSK